MGTRFVSVDSLCDRYFQGEPTPTTLGRSAVAEG